jgi:hypothetical protein
MSISTNLSATLATQTKEYIPTLPSFMRTHATLCSSGSLHSPLLLDTQSPLDSDFQTNSGLANISAYPALSGFGIRCPIAPGFFKNESLTAQDVVPPATLANAVGLSAASNDEHSFPALPLDPTIFEEDAFMEVFRLLNSIRAAVASCPSGSPTTPHYLDLDCQDPWTFSRPSTDAACSMDGEMHEMILPDPPLCLTQYSSSQSGNFPYMPSRSHSPASLGPFPDINMFDLAYMNRVPEAGVNPADIMCPLSVADPVCVTKRSASPPGALAGTSPTSTGQLPSVEVMNSIAAMLSNTVTKEDENPQTTVCPGPQRTAGKRGEFYHPKGRPMNEIAAHMGTSKRQTSSFNADEPPFAYRLPTPTAAAHRSPLIPVSFQTNQQPSFTSVLDCGSTGSDSPVLNAHLGIDLSELMAKADKYRTRFPGRAIDKKWLMAYAGKLTERGELLEDYRCYVNGCTQKNKRRDHILVHVGSHVDQRLFVCSVWYVEFENSKHG